MKKLSKEEMKKIKGGVTPCLSECYGACALAAHGDHVFLLECRETCRTVVCVEE